ncbi:MAG: hypothetical protein ACR2RB_09820 [Gammaproteobacteria bacterium]
MIEMLRDDVRDLNRVTIALAARASTDSDAGLNRLGLDRDVVSLMRAADDEARESAANCGQPLVQLQIRHLAEVLNGAVAASSVCPPLPASVQAWQHQALVVLQRCTLIEPELSVVWFDLPPSLVEKLLQYRLKDLSVMAEDPCGLFAVRYGQNRQCWRQLLVSPVVVGASRARSLAQTTALVQAAA